MHDTGEVFEALIDVEGGDAVTIGAAQGIAHTAMDAVG